VINVKAASSKRLGFAELLLDIRLLNEGLLMKKNYLFFILLLITGLGCSALFLPLSLFTARTGINFSSIVEPVIPGSLSKGTSYAAIIWLFGSAIMVLLSLIFRKLG